MRVFLNAIGTTILRLVGRSGDPGAPVDGELWYDSTAQKFRAREQGTSKDVIIAASGSDPLPLIAARHLFMN